MGHGTVQTEDTCTLKHKQCSRKLNANLCVQAFLHPDTHIGTVQYMSKGKASVKSPGGEGKENKMIRTEIRMSEDMKGSCETQERREVCSILSEG